MTSPRNSLSRVAATGLLAVGLAGVAVIAASMDAKAPAANAAATPVPASAKPVPTVAKGSFDSFRLIGDRNIFDPNRRNRSARSAANEPAAPTGDTIALVGTMDYAQGTFDDGHDPDRVFDLVFFQDLVDAFIDFVDLFRFLTFREKGEVYVMRYDHFEVFQAALPLVDTHHSFGTVKINAAQGISHQEPGFILFFGSYGIFQVEDDAIGLMNPGIDHQAGGIPRKIKS